MQINPKKINEFRRVVRTYYIKNKRDLPWRRTADPYRIFISEIMLQQTQVPRVLVKYPEFLKAFPNFESLAGSSLLDVLKVWQGMGYNRRAKYLRESAVAILRNFHGKLPHTPEQLDELPGIGRATACSIAAFVFNLPTVFIETNIRRVFIHHFFKDRKEIDDTELMPLVEKALDKKNPREWYWALMDYGSYLVKIVDNPNKKSRHYVRQSAFGPSDRRIRGLILKKLLLKPFSSDELSRLIVEPAERVEKIIDSLVREDFLVKKGKKFNIK